MPPACIDRASVLIDRASDLRIIRPSTALHRVAASHSLDNGGDATSTMARRPREVPPPHPLIGFTQPIPAAGDHLIRVVVVLDSHSKKWGFFEVSRAVVVADDVDDVTDVPADLEYPFDDQTEAVHAALGLGQVPAISSGLRAIPARVVGATTKCPGPCPQQRTTSCPMTCSSRSTP